MEHTNEELAIAIQQGNTELIPQLYEQVKRFIAVYAGKYWSHLPEEQQAIFEKSDFEQCGWPALCDAVKSFRPDSECSFLTWLTYYLRKEFVAQRGHRYNVTNDEDRKQYYRFIHADSVDAPVPGTEDLVFADMIQDPDSYGPFESVEDRIQNEQLRHELDRNIAELPAQQQRIINGTYFAGLNQAELAQREQCSFQWVSQQHKHALRRLKQNALRQTGAFKSRLASFLDERTDFYHGTAENAVIHREWLEAKCLRHPDLVINLPE